MGSLTAVAQQSPKRRAVLKTSLNAYSFNKLLNDNLKGRGKGITLPDLLDYCADLTGTSIHASR